MSDVRWLAEAERAVLSGLRVPKRRADWLLGRFAAKRALVAAGEAVLESEVAILPAASGAPEAFLRGTRLPVTLSITHAHGRAAAAVAAAGMRLGLDLERVEPRPSGFLRDWFTPAERRIVESAPAAEADLLTTLLWSAKESVLKALREGLRVATTAVDVSPSPGPADGTWHAFAARGPGEAAWRGWWQAQGGFVLSAVAEPSSGPPERIG